MPHAPGPWRIEETETRTAIKSGKRAVAYVQMARDDYENANLIVAAPEMLSALQWIVRASMPGGSYRLTGAGASPTFVRAEQFSMFAPI